MVHWCLRILLRRDLSTTGAGFGKSVMSKLDPPETVVGMTEWQPRLFECKVKVPSFIVPSNRLAFIVKQCKPVFLKVPKLNPVREVVAESGLVDKCHKTVLLDPNKVAVMSDLPEPAMAYLESTGVELSTTEVSLDCSNFSPKTMLRKVLSQTEEDVSGYSLVGHICHLNLRDSLEPFKKVIGEILLLLPNVRTVVNKINAIDNTYRNFQMEVVAGEADTFQVSVKENGVKFELDFSKVYWNPRLSTEHSRLVSKLAQGDVFYDVMAGVGPFAVPAAAMAGVTVFANDLNPESFKWLQHNMKLNKIEVGEGENSKVKCFNMDGTEFIKTVVKDGLSKWFRGEIDNQIHIAMNLPDSAIEFLPAFSGLLADETPAEREEAIGGPLIHVYAFTSEDDYLKDLTDRCQKSLGLAYPPPECTADWVRNVAPQKNMYRVTIRLTHRILSSQTEDFVSHAAKRQKIED